MVQAFRDLGVEAVPGVGHPFDPNFHEAIMQEPNDDVPDGTILQEFRKGFQCGDRLLRAAMVKVAFILILVSAAAAAAAAHCYHHQHRSQQCCFIFSFLCVVLFFCSAVAVVQQRIWLPVCPLESSHA